jgi:2-succinyl-6-hydroxy-2,4-cyclohexadiene-1-carboxylate synthase
MSKGLVFALHGFLGESSDWDLIKNGLAKKDIEVVAPNLFGPGSEKIQTAEIFTKKITEGFTTSKTKKIFLGYSLGGRLGLSILANTPQLFDHYVFLSTNPGLSDLEEAGRQDRVKRDEQLVNSLDHESWNQFIINWNKQSVFEGSKEEPVREAQNFDIEKLKSALTVWSLGKQLDYSNVIKKNQDRITWVVGDSDKKYVQIAEDLKQKKILLDYKRISSSHRIWCDQPLKIIELLQHLF